MLGRFERDLALLAAVAILPGAQTEQLRTLADLVPREQYCDWAAKCSACHDNLASKVGGRLSLLFRRVNLASNLIALLSSLCLPCEYGQRCWRTAVLALPAMTTSPIRWEESCLSALCRCRWWASAACDARPAGAAGALAQSITGLSLC